MIAPRTNDGKWDAYLKPLRDLLRGRRGPGQAITLDAITETLGLPNRRAAEQLLEDHVGNLGFVVVAGGPGYWRPAAAAEINTYRASLHKRHVALKDREDALVAAALQEGWQIIGNDFAEPPQRQPELFSLPAAYFYP